MSETTAARYSRAARPEFCIVAARSIPGRRSRRASAGLTPARSTKARRGNTLKNGNTSHMAERMTERLWV